MVRSLAMTQTNRLIMLRSYMHPASKCSCHRALWLGGLLYFRNLLFLFFVQFFFFFLITFYDINESLLIAYDIK